MLTNVLILIAGLVVLGIAAHYLINASVQLAKIFKLPEILIGLTIVSIGTSAPEIAVSVIAALDGQGALSVGNVIGSNIFNLGFILGVIALMHAQKIHRKMVYRDGVVLFISTLMALYVIWDQQVVRWEGIMLLTTLVAYNVYLFVKKDAPAVEEAEEIEAEAIALHGKEKQWYDAAIVVVVSLYFLVNSADHVVEAAVEIAQSFGMSEWAIGVTIVAAGTSLPEVAASVVATIKRKFDIAVGNVVGSDIFNTLGIIGVSSLVAPLALDSRTIFGLPDNVFSMIILVFTIGLILVMMRTGWKLSRKEGLLLLIIAVARMIMEGYLGSR